MKILMINGSPRLNGNTTIALDEMKKAKIQDRFSKYGFWYYSDDNIISSVKENYWTDEDDENDKENIV